MEFILINNDKDIQELMKQFSFFHDSCITEIHYISGSYVTDDKNMYPLNSKRELLVKFQSQMSKLKTLELKFSKIKQCCLNPKSDDYDSIILGTYFQIKDDFVYWADCEDFPIENELESNCTWVIAESVSWRIINE